MDKWINAIRQLQRPLITILIIVAITYISLKLVIPYANEQIALMFVTFLLSTGSAIIGFTYGERASKNKTVIQ